MTDPAPAKQKCTEEELTANFNEAVNNLREAYNAANEDEKVQILLLMDSLNDKASSKLDSVDSDLVHFLTERFKIVDLRKLIGDLQKELGLHSIEYIKKEIVINWFKSFWPKISTSNTEACKDFCTKYEEFRNSRSTN